MPNKIAHQVIKLNSVESEKACRDITATLPEWFGIPEANEKNAQGVQDKDRFSLGYMDNGVCVGMLSLEFPFSNSANIYWMAVKKEAHCQGIGTALLSYAEKLCLERNIYTLTVETLSPKEEDSNYLKTYQFYLKEGFRPLFEVNTYGPDFLMVYLGKTLSPKIFEWVDLTHELSEENAHMEWRLWI